MRRPAIRVFGMLAVAACWSNQPPAPTTPLGNRAASAPPLVGAYSCSIEDGYQYPPFPCVIRSDARSGRLVLEKLGGSQRFTGHITPRGGGFDFDGQFFCPWGDCTQALHGRFEPDGSAMRARAFRGRFRDATMIVRLVADAGDGFGGSEYGGARYGGASYGNNGALQQPRNPDP